MFRLAQNLEASLDPRGGKWHDSLGKVQHRLAKRNNETGKKKTYKKGGQKRAPSEEIHGRVSHCLLHYRAVRWEGKAP